jgi:hypothetical protein
MVLRPSSSPGVCRQEEEEQQRRERCGNEEARNE